MKATLLGTRPRTAPGSRRANDGPSGPPGRLLRVRRSVPGWCYLAPAIGLFALFGWYPIFRGIQMAFQEDNLIDPPRWIGLENFRHMLTDPLLAVAWRNTIMWTLLSLLFGFAIPIFVALIINELRRGRGFFQMTVFLPSVLPPVVAVVLWKWFYDPDPDVGLFNQALGLFGLPAMQWLDSATMAMPSLVMQSVWAGSGGTALFYLAALQSIPGELYEAAEVDGAGFFRRVWHVTFPQLRYVMLVLFILDVVGSMQVFVQPYIMTGGGPGDATTTVLLLIFRYAFQYNDFGTAAALSLILAVVLAVLSAVYLRLTRKWAT
ncbi:MAG: ABC transporter permease subunit [Micromonosporaceae bacterium]|nr:ABC transporter permease subunit [Micromonosporaceae bacterium]